MLQMNESDDDADSTAQSVGSKKDGKKKTADLDVTSQSEADTGSAAEISQVRSGSKSARSSRSVSRSTFSQLEKNQTEVSRNVGKAKRQENAIKVGSLNAKKCTFVVINVSKFHAVASEAAPTIVQHHSKIIDHILKSFTATKGVPDTFCGDRIMCTFNAVRPLGSFRTAACTAVMESKAKVANDPDVGKYLLSCSVATGEAQIGNMGTDMMRRFTYVSSIVTWCFALERYSRHIGAVGLMDVTTKDEACNSFVVRLVDGVIFEKRKGKNVIKVHELLQARAAAEEEEWMYQLEKQQDDSPWKHWETCVEAVLSQKWEDATAAKENALVADETGSEGSLVGSRLKEILEAKTYVVQPILMH